MDKKNYDKEMCNIIVKGVKALPTLLLHSCCAPCSTACIERLKEHFLITVYYYNPNIDSQSEYDLRSSEQVRLCKELGINCIVEKYNPSEFIDAVRGLEGEKEGGARCEKCFRLRLEKTAEKASSLYINYFATTLTVSPHKNSTIINQIGEQVQFDKSQPFLPSDFKKRNGYLRSINLSKEYNLYRQNYCGCVYSKGHLEDKGL